MWACRQRRKPHVLKKLCPRSLSSSAPRPTVRGVGCVPRAELNCVGAGGGRGQPASYKNQRGRDFSPGQWGRRWVGKIQAARSHLGQGCNLQEQGCPRSS